MGDESTVLRLREYQKRTTGEVTLEQARQLRSRFGRYLSVELSWQEQGSFELSAGNHIGTIVTDGLRIHIEPKTPLTNLFFMLTYAYDMVKFREGEAPLAVGGEIFEFLLEIFVKQIDQLVRQGIYRGYVDNEEDRRYLRGRLMLAKQLQTSAGVATRFHQRTNELTADLRENRVLKFALWQLARMGLEDVDLRRRMRRTLSAFSEVTLSAMTPTDCERVIYTRLNGSYETPISLARLFLQHLSLEGHAGETAFSTYLLPMHDIFELFVARYLEAFFAEDPTYSVEIQPQIYLDEEQRERGKPDIVIHKDGRPYLILDTKYKLFKEKPDRADLNQMIVYSHTMGVRRAVLIYSDARSFHYSGKFRGMTVSARPLSLDGELDTFRERCRVFAEGFAKEIAEEG